MAVRPAGRFSFVGRVMAVLLFLVVITDCFLFTGARYCIIFLFEKFRLFFALR